jgi:Fur family peroxide stress response transcriptional regulator
MTSRERQSALTGMRLRCKDQGMAFTFQRQVIYEAVLDSLDHPTPERIYEQVRERIPSISLATVYKNVKTFLDAGLLKEVSLHHGSLRIEANMAPHHHLVCAQCRAIFDLEESQIGPVKLKDALPKGFSASAFHVEVVGVCASCARSKSSKTVKTPRSRKKEC